MDEELKNRAAKEEEPETQTPEEGTAPESTGTPEQEQPSAEEKAPEEPKPDPLEEATEKLKQEQDKYLRLAAEYDNYRKRSQKEKDNLYRDAKADTVAKFLPVYDNLARALEQETEDAAYKKGVEMTMTGLVEILKKLDVTIYGEPGETFSPDLHNAVMHIEDEQYGEGQIVQVFQKGFKLGEKVIRFAMVQTAN